MKDLQLYHPLLSIFVDNLLVVTDKLVVFTVKGYTVLAVKEEKEYYTLILNKYGRIVVSYRPLPFNYFLFLLEELHEIDLHNHFKNKNERQIKFI